MDTAGDHCVEDHLPDAGSDVCRFQIFGPSGAWLGGVAASADLGEIIEIGEDYIVSAWKDELDVPYVLVSRIRKE